VNYNVLDAGAQVAPATTFTKQKLSFNTLNIKEEGHLFVYLSYDNDSNNWVYFDDFKITHNRSNVIQYNEYYPFGMQTAKSCLPAGAPKTEIFGAEVGTRDGSKNDYLYNAGNEMNSNTGWYETFFRGYDATLGKFLQTDPMADKYGSWTPYNYAFNDPVYWNDPNGADPYTTSAREYYESVVERDGYQDGSVGMYGYSWNMATYGSASGAGGATSNGGFGYGYHGRWEKYESGGYYENRPNSLQPENLVWKPTYSYRFIADTQNNGKDRRGYIAAVSNALTSGTIQYSWEEALGVGRAGNGGPGDPFWNPGGHPAWKIIRDGKDISSPDYPGVKIYESPLIAKNTAVTLPGIGIVIHPSISGTSKTKVLQHEYGHFLDYKVAPDLNFYTPASPSIPIVNFYIMIGIPSIINAATGLGGDHSSYWTEVRANQWAQSFFGSKYISDPINYPTK
jgi:RHS repeat-associated protein